MGTRQVKILARIEDILLKEKHDMVYIQGDTNLALACTLVTSKLHINIGMRKLD
jgi:UDP-N-acetylglucosamine 2-epimerase (non-hydrolysing)